MCGALALFTIEQNASRHRPTARFTRSFYKGEILPQTFSIWQSSGAYDKRKNAAQKGSQSA
ncbi:hypothetical protein GP5015_938 [gamma proteobacterium HTCC5015]|nr:hypothetical protein GP5015_938 [gamma proteobacterium HTCC5015]